MKSGLLTFLKNITRIWPHWACIRWWRQLTGAIAYFSCSQVCHGPRPPQGAVSAAVRHCPPHFTWHPQMYELVTSASESSSTFKLPTFTPAMICPKPASAKLLFTQPPSREFQFLLDCPEKNLLIDPWHCWTTLQSRNDGEHPWSHQ